jgi:hypothetical protein
VLRDNLAGLIEPMVDRSGSHLLGFTDFAIVALKRSWRKLYSLENGSMAEKRIWPDLAVTTEAQESRAVGAVQHQSHRAIGPQCLENPRPEGAESALMENAASPFQAEPIHPEQPQRVPVRRTP